MAREERTDECRTLRSEPAAELEAEGALSLRLLSSPDTKAVGRHFVVPAVGCEIGRQRGQTPIWLADRRLSRRHAYVVPDAAARVFTVEDLGSNNGTWVNGARVTSGELRLGDILRVGDSVFVARRRDPDLERWRPPRGSGIVARSAAFRSVVDAVERVATTQLPVLVEGETGVGKDLVARLVHAQSGRRGEFVAVNCASLGRELAASELFGHVRGAFSGAERDRKGLFAAASGGTLFLDEVGELRPEVQSQLLRALETGTVRPVGAARSVVTDVRFVAATNVDLEAAVGAGSFRADLYARLAQWTVHVPPLRARPEDISALASHVVETYSGDASYQLSGELAEALVLEKWPRNTRELFSHLRRLMLTQPEGGRLKNVTADGGAPAAPSGARATVVPPSTRSAAPTQERLEQLLAGHGGCVADVARALSVQRMQIYRWCRRFGLDPAQFRG